MTEKQINKWLRHRFSLVGWVLTGYIVLMNVLAMAAITLDGAARMYQYMVFEDFVPDFDAVYSNAWGYLLTIAVGLVVLHSWKGRSYWKQEILVKEKSMTPGVLFTVFSFCVGTQMVNSLWIGLLETIMNAFGKSLMPYLENISGASSSVSMFLYASVIGPIAEEILFRGYVLRSLRPYGKRFAILGSALLFGLFHGNLMQTPYAFLMGLVLGWVAAEYSVIWAMALHLFNNLVLADLFSRLTVSLTDEVFALFNLGIFGTFTLISAVLLIVNRKKIRAYRQSEWMDRRCLKCFFTSSGIITLTVLMVLTMASMFFM